LWQRSSEVLEARAAVAAAESERRRAFLYPNPTLDFGWNTIPVGRTNPPGLEDRWSKVPNYAVSVAELVELGKRGPRQRALTWDRERAHWQLVAIFGDRFFALLEAAGRLAANQRKLHLLGELVQDTSELLELDRARASRGEIPALDVDIAAVELARLVANRDQVQADLNQARADCSALIALSCPLFPSPEAAAEFLERAAAASFDEGWSEAAEQRRPDLSALAAALSAAQERVVLAQRKVIPDLTLRAGYTYDQFTVSGNQRNSVAVGVSLPLPVADRGQADLFAAQAEAARARQLRARLLESIPQQIEAARQQRALARERKERLDGALEKARAARDAVAAAQQAGGISLIEVLVARRNYLELLRERADVDFDAFAATLALRKLLGLFPRPPEANADGGFTLP
jgi:cobalt-zinc-cadmium efflux system outer membrane protein